MTVSSYVLQYLQTYLANSTKKKPKSPPNAKKYFSLCFAKDIFFKKNVAVISVNAGHMSA